MEEKQKVSAYEIYAEEKLGRPEYRRMKINIERINRILANVENSWMGANRRHALKELENLLDRQHEQQDVPWQMMSDGISNQIRKARVCNE